MPGKANFCRHAARTVRTLKHRYKSASAAGRGSAVAGSGLSERIGDEVHRQRLLGAEPANLPVSDIASTMEDETPILVM